MPKLSALAHGRDNNFQLIRLLSATAVVLFHSYALTNHWEDEPLWQRIPELNLGALGVGIFFVISGYLITQSWLVRGRILPFVAARMLRIYPALVGAVALSLLLAGISSALDWRSFLSHPQTVDFILHVTPAWEMRYRLPGAFPANPMPHDVNGSLWTLPIELRLYIAVLIVGVAGLLARRIVWLAAFCALVALYLWRPEWFPWPPHDLATRGLVLLFALGSLASVWRGAIPISLTLAAIALLLVIVNPAGPHARCDVCAVARLHRARCRLPSPPQLARVQPHRRLFLRRLCLRVPDSADPHPADSRNRTCFTLCAGSSSDARGRRSVMALHRTTGARTKITVQLSCLHRTP